MRATQRTATGGLYFATVAARAGGNTAQLRQREDAHSRQLVAPDASLSLRRLLLSLIAAPPKRKQWKTERAQFFTQA
jgi:hypothetical protein